METAVGSVSKPRDFVGMSILQRSLKQPWAEGWKDPARVNQCHAVTAPKELASLLALISGGWLVAMGLCQAAYAVAWQGIMLGSIAKKIYSTEVV